MSLGSITLDDVQSLYDRGLYLQAYESSKEFGSFSTWKGTRQLILAGRLAEQLGNRRLAAAMHWLAVRGDPNNVEARYYSMFRVIDRFGSIAAWQRMRKLGDPVDSDDESVADWHLLKAHVLASLRDFDRAEQSIARAKEITAEKPWFWVTVAYLHRQKDEIEKAALAAQQSLELQPYFRPAAQAYADCLMQQDRVHEARDFLLLAAQHLESAAVLLQLAGIEAELRHFDDALANYRKAERFLPLADEKDLASYVAPMLAEFSYRAGDYESAAANADRCKGEHFVEFAKRLRDPNWPRQRVELPVAFVLQHHMTCAPACLSMITSYFGEAADHLDIANEICYDGTPPARQRQWLETHGFSVKQFDLSFDAAVTLIDRGVPFLLETVAVNSSHAQVVMGYDTVRQSILIREPSNRFCREFDVDYLIKSQSAWGPRCMAFVPASKASLLEEVSLPEEKLQDLQHQVELTISINDRPSAEEAWQTLRSHVPEHRITHSSHWRLAIYDGNLPKALAAVDGLRAKFPEDETLRYKRLGLMHAVASARERADFLKDCMENPQCHPLFLVAEARQSVSDHRSLGQAEYLMKKAIRRSPGDATPLAALSDVRWQQNRREESLELARFASTLEDKNDGYAQLYLTRAQILRRHAEAIEVFEARHRRDAHRSVEPGLLLSWAYEQINQRHRAIELVEEMLRESPENGSVLMTAVGLYSAMGNLDRAAELVELAQSRVAPRDGISASARLALKRGDLSSSLSLWRSLLETEPLSEEAHRAICELTGKLTGQEDVQKHLDESIKKYPHNYMLNSLRIETLRSQGPTVHEAAIRQMLDVHPNDGWAMRELALCLKDQNRMEEATELAETCRQLEPYHPSTYFVNARIKRAKGDLKESRKDYRRAIRCDVDFDWALIELLSTSANKKQRIKDAQFFLRELAQQVTTGQGILAFWQHAGGVLDPLEVLKVLKQARRERPDLWQAWYAHARQLLDMKRPDDALTIIRRGIKRFPHEVDLRFLLADIHQQNKDLKSAIRTMNTVRKFAPHRVDVLCRLGSLYRYDGNLDQAKRRLKTAVSIDPRDATALGLLAEVHYASGDKEEAIAEMERAATLSIAHDGVWNRLQEWCAIEATPERAINLARRLTEQQPFELLAWQRLAGLLTRPEEQEERLAAAKRCMELAPLNLNGHDQFILSLQSLGRSEEALAACRPAIFNGQFPVMLLAREAHLRNSRGEFAQAKELAEEVLSREPDYPFAVQALFDASIQLSATEEYIRAADKLVELLPDDANSYGCRSYARQLTKDVAGEKSDLARLLELAPHYSQGFYRLLELQIDAKEFEGARQTVIRRSEHLSPGLEPALNVAIACREENKSELAKSMEDLWKVDELSNEALNSLAAVPNFLGIGGTLSDKTLKLITSGRNTEALGSIWSILMFKDRGTSSLLSGMRKLESSQKAWRGAVYAMPYFITANEYSSIRSFVWRNREWLAYEDRLWSVAGRLLAQGNAAESIKWFRDWKKREGIDGQTYFTISNQLWHLNDEVSATAICELALSKSEDEYSPYHRARLGVVAVKKGEFEKLKDLAMKGLPTIGNDFYGRIAAGIDLVLQDLKTSARGTEPAKELLSKLRSTIGVEAEMTHTLNSFTDGVSYLHELPLKAVLRTLPSTPEMRKQSWGRAYSWIFLSCVVISWILKFLSDLLK